MFTGEEPIKINAAEINGLTIEKDYDNDLFPIMHVNLIIRPMTYYKIVKNKTTVKFRMKLESYKFEPSVESSKFKKVVFNEIFSIFVDDNTPFFQEDSYKRMKEIERDETPITDFSKSYDLYLFKDSDMNIAKKKLNYVLSSANMADTLAYHFSKIGLTKVLMTPIHNSRTFTEIVIPPLKLDELIYYMERLYGFYPEGVLLFLDYDCTYFINKSPTCKAFRPNEYKQTIVTVRKALSTDNSRVGNYYDDKLKQYFLNIPKQDVYLTTNSVIENQVNGNNIIILDTAGNDASAVDAKTESRGGSADNIIINNYGTCGYSKSIMHARKVEEANILEATASDFDMDCMSPNKEFVFIFEDTALNKVHGSRHRLSRIQYNFYRAGKEYGISANMLFKKH